MHALARRFVILCGVLLLTGCLWGPGKFQSQLTLKKDGSFVLDYKGEIVLSLPAVDSPMPPWSDERARCRDSGSISIEGDPEFPDDTSTESTDPVRPCTAEELARMRADYEQRATDHELAERKRNEEFVRMFGLPGTDEDSARAFAATLSKYAGWRSVSYRGNGVYDVDYHFEGRATQDFLFPALPDNDLIIPFVAIRRQADGSVLVTAPALTGGSGPLGSRMPAPARPGPDTPPSRAEGRLVIVTDGEILTNNSEDGPSAHAVGRQLQWDVGPLSKKIPEALIRLR